MSNNKKMIFIPKKIKRKYFIKHLSYIPEIKYQLDDNKVWGIICQKISPYKNSELPISEFETIVSNAYYYVKNKYYNKNGKTNVQKPYNPYKNDIPQKSINTKSVLHNPNKCQYYLRKGGYCSSLDMKCHPKSSMCYYTYREKDSFSISQNESHNNNYRNSKNLDSFIYSKTIDATDITPILRVYSGYLTIQNVKLIDCKMIVSDDKHINRYNIFVIENPKNNKYYIPINYVNYYNRKKYMPNVKYEYANSQECSKPLTGYEFRMYSPLKLYGYAVGKTNGRTKNDRQRIILFVIHNNIMSVANIVSLLNQNINNAENRPNSNMNKAISDWKEDLEFIHEWRMKQ